MSYGCTYCAYSTEKFKDIVNHLIDEHSCEEMRMKRIIGRDIKLVSYKIIPDMCREEGRTISIDEHLAKIHVSRRGVVPKESPLKKILRFDSSQDTGRNEEEEQIMQFGAEQENEDNLGDLIKILPDVIESLKKCGKLDDYMAFNQLVSENKFPIDNIAFLLFLDVVRWFALEKSTVQMRYSEECKTFWTTGYRLFHGRFLRFMGGPKNKGLVTESDAKLEKFLPENSKINFAVPDRRMLKENIKMVPRDKPGIIKEMIEDVVKNDNSQHLTYKICVDGKKINPSSKGEVNLWGHEDSPTSEERKQRTKNELSLFSLITDKINILLEMGNSYFHDIDDSEMQIIKKGCQQTVTSLSNRIKDLRLIRVKKEMALNKLLERVEGDWRSSNFAMVISSIRTNIYQIENCIEDMLNVNEKLCKYAALDAKGRMTAEKEQVDLMHQHNYVCLGEKCNSNADSRLVKQRTDTWHKIRDSSVVTGSTINKAIGLDGLKQMRNYMDIKAGRKEQEPISEELKSKFSYGSKNELNAVATFVTNFLPSFVPNAVLYEEGCYVIEEHDKKCIVISPDGSVRQGGNDSHILAGVEIKCPMPGKLFTTPVQYTLPHYYVTQVLSEMKCLDTECLYFVSYSKESTAIHLVEFDNQLWNDISREITALDLNRPPKKLSTEVNQLKSRIEEYRDTKVHLLAEVKSKKAVVCTHSTELSGRIYHQQQEPQAEVAQLREIYKTFIRGNRALLDCETICVQKASEVLVFLLADLDRMHKSEVPYAFPVAYAFKGYSMKASAMRCMIDDLLYELFMKGLYTPVIAFDGQWASLTYRAADGKALTLLELQKQVYDETKSKKKSELTKRIFDTGVVKAEDFVLLSSQIQCTYSEVNKSFQVSTKPETKLFCPSIHVHHMISSYERKKDKETDEQSKTPENGTDQIFSGLPSDLIDKLSEEEVQELTGVNNYITARKCAEVNITYDISDTFLVANNNKDDISNPANVSMDVDQEHDTTEVDQSAADNITIVSEKIPEQETLLKKTDIANMLLVLQSDEKTSGKWNKTSFDQFEASFTSPENLKSLMTKYEMTLCIKSAADSLQEAKIAYSKYWNKTKMSDLLHKCVNQTSLGTPDSSKKRRRRSPDKLVSLCKRKINKLSKEVINVVVAEYDMVDRVKKWREASPFSPVTKIGRHGITWFSTPEYNLKTLSFIFSYIDVHHLITNCRVKVCKDGLPSRGISRQAWVYVAKTNNTRLNIAHVEDLVDKQSDAIAKETFSAEVEDLMRNQYPREANFCKLIREFYEAEDEPGISVTERFKRRLALRDWLLNSVNFCKFPPYGSHINGIPNVMFQGFMTNIERRLQIFPFVKSGSYNVRALGSLEAENLFGQFQDLDPKGSGVVKAEEIPSALENACQLLRVRLSPNRPFHMVLSKAKVYPEHELLFELGQQHYDQNPKVYPLFLKKICLRDHLFDAKSRSNRRAKRRLVNIKGPDEAARGVSGVRQHHKCDQSKILSHKRLGLDL